MDSIDTREFFSTIVKYHQHNYIKIQNNIWIKFFVLLSKISIIYIAFFVIKINILEVEQSNKKDILDYKQ